MSQKRLCGNFAVVSATHTTTSSVSSGLIFTCVISIVLSPCAQDNSSCRAHAASLQPTAHKHLAHNLADSTTPATGGGAHAFETPAPGWTDAHEAPQATNGWAAGTDAPDQTVTEPSIMVKPESGVQDADVSQAACKTLPEPGSSDLQSALPETAGCAEHRADSAQEIEPMQTANTTCAASRVSALGKNTSARELKDGRIIDSTIQEGSTVSKPAVDKDNLIVYPVSGGGRSPQLPGCAHNGGDDSAISIDRRDCQLAGAAGASVIDRGRAGSMTLRDLPNADAEAWSEVKVRGSKATLATFSNGCAGRLLRLHAAALPGKSNSCACQR